MSKNKQEFMLPDMASKMGGPRIETPEEIEARKTKQKDLDNWRKIQAKCPEWHQMDQNLTQK